MEKENIFSDTLNSQQIRVNYKATKHYKNPTSKKGPL